MDSRTGKKLVNTNVAEESGGGEANVPAGGGTATFPPVFGVEDGVGAHASG